MSTLTISDAPRPYRDRSSDHVAIVECQSDDHARWTMRHQVIWQYRYLRSRGVGPLSARAGVIGSLFTRGYPMSMVVVDHTER